MYVEDMYERGSRIAESGGGSANCGIRLDRSSATLTAQDALISAQGRAAIRD